MITKTPTNLAGFLAIKPTNFDPSKKYPVVVFFHGMGERGTGDNAGLEVLLTRGIPSPLQLAVDAGQFILYAGQCPSTQSWPLTYIDHCVKVAFADPNVNPDAAIITGLSLGGGAVLRYITSTRERRLKFKAAIPICPVKWGTNWANAVDMPIWFFHAEDDPTVNVSSTNDSVAAILALDPNAPVKKTLYPTGGHAIWKKVYSTPEVLPWAFDQCPKPVGPIADFTWTWQNHIYIKLDATPSQRAVSYKWEIVSRPTEMRVDYNDQPRPAGLTECLQGIAYMTPGPYQIKLTVTDAAGLTNSITKDIQVL